MDITNYSIWLHWLIIQTWGPWYLLTESCQQRVANSGSLYCHRAESERVAALMIPFDQGDPAESLVCLGPLGAGQSPYVLPHHEGQGVHWEVFKIYLRSISSLFWLDWFVQAKLFLMNQIFWKINIEIWNRRLVDLRQSRDGVDKVTTFSYIYIIAHYGDLHADISSKNIQTCLSLVTQEVSCLNWAVCM